ncbi:MAG TPA: phosphotransferase [Egibacteraceae bacterium]|nr:phosphotransferase [Egibacteraceae bacterium]
MSGEAGQGLRAAGTPPAAVRLDVAVVRALLAAQHPDLAALALRAVAAGWDNATFRLGQDLAVRLPRRAVAATLMEHEQRWLRGLARRLSCPSPPRCAPAVPGPATRGAGVWSHGCPASRRPRPAGSRRGHHLRTVPAGSAPAPAQVPTNPCRGVPLRTRAPAVGARINRLRHSVGVDGAQLRRAWHRALDALPTEAPVWTHGDLHPRNVLFHRGRLSAVIDWGNLAQGDPGAGLAGDPRLAAVGRRTLARIGG